MSSSRVWPCCLVYLLAPILAAAQSGQQPYSGVLICPAKIAVEESASPVSGWLIEPGSQQRLFERISVFQVSPQGQEFDLAPDSEKRSGSIISQTWSIAENPSMKFMLRCRYRYTLVTLKKEIPAGVRACHLKYAGSANGAVSGPSEMSCR